MFSKIFLTPETRDWVIQNCLAYSYDYRLVVLSCFVAMFASYTAFYLITRVSAASNRSARAAWLITGAVCMGGSIWSMHFIAMLAVRIPAVVRYDPLLTALSVVFAIAASGIAFYFVSRGVRTLAKFILGGTLMGGGIAAMHYTGMTAMHTGAEIRYDPLLFAASILVAVSLSTIAMRFLQQNVASNGAPKHALKLVGGCVMGLSIAAMHYTAMAATYFLPAEAPPSSGLELDAFLVATSIGAATLLITGLALTASFVDRRMEIKDRESEKQYRLLIDRMQDGLYLVQDERLVFVNEALARMLGYRTDELIGREVWDVIAPESEVMIRDYYRRRRAGEDVPVVYDCEWLHKDGATRIPVILNVGLTETEDGKPATIGTVKDITKRKQAEEAVKESEARFRDFADVASDWFWEQDADLRFTMASPEVHEKSGVKARDHIGKTRRDIVELGVSEEQWRRHDADLAARRPFRDFTFQRRAPSGELRDLSISGKPVLDAEGHFKGYRGIGTDITERKRSEMALKQSEERLRGIIDNSPAAIVLKDTKGRYLVANKVFLEWLNVSYEDCVGKTAHDFMGKDTADSVTAQERLVMETGVPKVQERQAKPPDGITRTVLSHKYPIFGPEGACIGVGTVMIDMTDQRKIENQLRQAQKMEVVGQLTGGVAHDFNNMLGVIIGNLDFLAEELPEDTGLLPLVEAAATAALNGANLNRQLLAFSRQQSLSPKVIDLNDNVTAMLGMLRRTLGETIEIETKQSDGLWAADVDPAQVESALLNLAVNARHAMPEGGKLTIETANVRLDDDYVSAHSYVTPGEYVMLAVTDTGAGISPENLTHVFEPFFTTKDVGEGSGLGLSMVYGFTKQSGGHVEIQSEESVGTTLKLYLPRAQRAAETVAEESVEIQMAQGETVLVVEDDPGLLILVANQLGSLGYEVLEAKDGATALATLDGTRGVDLLLTDVVMPGGISGPALVEKAVTRHPDIKVLFISGYAPEAMEHSGQLDNDAPLLQKPYRRPELARMLRTVLDT